MTLEHLIMLRHGVTQWNAELRMQGHKDVPLSDAGHAQATSAAASIAALEPEVVISSDLLRAQATAQIVSGELGLDVRHDERLRETSLGEWEGRTRAEVMAGWPGAWERWRSTSAAFAPPGGESRLEVASRASAVVDELDAAHYRRALLVTHGGLIVGLTGFLLKLPDPQWNSLVGVGNCHWVVLHRSSGAQWRLHAYNGGLSGIVMPDAQDEVAGA